MIKGVNKQIVEINCTRDEYIERAILFVNPQKSSLPRELLEKKAGDYLNSLLPRGTNEVKLPPLRKLTKPQKPLSERLLLIALIVCCVLTATVIVLPFLL